MPLPERYQIAVPDMTKVWGPEGYFGTQAEVWDAQCQARHERLGVPTSEGLMAIRGAMVLSEEDIAYLNQPRGHETVRLQRLIQRRLPTELGNEIHRWMTSRDVLDTALSLQILASLKLARAELELFSAKLYTLAQQHRETLKISRTHGQHALPHSFGNQVLSWYAENQRSLDRISRAEQIIAFGKSSGEVGTNVFMPPELEERSLEILGLQPEPAPTQMVSRDRHAEVVLLMAVCGGGLARFATDIGTMARTEIGEAEEPFDEHGSSAMPHKRNPELAERIRALYKRIKSSTSEALDTQVYWDQGDMTNSAAERFTYTDLFGCLLYSARLANIIVDGLKVNVERMAENVEMTQGAIYSSRLLNELIIDDKMPRTEAYDLVKKLSHQALATKTHLLSLASRDPQISQLIPQDQLKELFDPAFYLKNIDAAYRRVGGFDEETA